jgi:hypothetical protein
MVLALDCGHAVNPDQIAQVEGHGDGPSAAFYASARCSGRMTELN